MGRPKALLVLGQETMLGRVVRLLGEVVSPVVVVAAVGQELPALPPDVLIVRDKHDGRGPLEGLAAGLAALNGRADAAYVSGCDAPFLRPAFVRRLIESTGNHLTCVPRVDGHCHPLAGVYRLESQAAVAKLLQTGQFRASALTEIVPTRFVEAAELADVDPELESLRNLNTLDDYETALRRIGDPWAQSTNTT
jgi:molybdopterin-guanine dinucleotide biosynthesis protein A